MIVARYIQISLWIDFKMSRIGIGTIFYERQILSTFQFWALSILPHTIFQRVEYSNIVFCSSDCFVFVVVAVYSIVLYCVMNHMTSWWFTHLESCDFFHDYIIPLKCRFHNEYFTHILIIEVCSIDSLVSSSLNVKQYLQSCCRS